MLSFFLAKHFFLEGNRSSVYSGHKASKPAIRIATYGIAIGLAVMILSLCFVKGFQYEIRQKITGFTSHLEVLDLKSFSSPESYPVITDSSIIKLIKKNHDVKQVQRFSQKIGVLKTPNDFAGIFFKGVGKDYDLSFISQYVVEGKIPNFACDTSTNSIVISRVLAQTLKLELGDKIYSYFFSDNIKQRRFKIAAIYDTHMPQFDKNIVWTNIQTINKLNGWGTNLSSGLEIKLKDFQNISAVQNNLAHQITGHVDDNGGHYSVLSIKENPRTTSILSWLELLDFNVLIILLIMIGVASITMISGLLILILERTNTIGILKALGCTNRKIRHAFLWYSSFIIVRGMLIGNMMGCGFALIQDSFKIIRLDSEVYYIDYVPVQTQWISIFLLNVVCLLITMIALIIPSLIVSRIQPAKSIQFD